MTERILFVFEGEKTEKTVTDSLLKHFIENDSRIVLSSFKTDIYTLYAHMKKDEDLDAFALVKEKDENLNEYSRDSFSQLYLFFDYDGHSNSANDIKIDELLDFFDEETENGKLFISYPMIEAMKCIADLGDLNSFCRHTYPVKDGSGFKKFVSEYSCKSLIHFGLYTILMWNDIVRLHCVKANFMISGETFFPMINISQVDLFEVQKSKYISIDNSVATLGAFPLLLLDFFGGSKLSTLVSGETITATNVLRSS